MNFVIKDDKSYNSTEAYLTASQLLNIVQHLLIKLAMLHEINLTILRVYVIINEDNCGDYTITFRVIVKIS
jgi:hypothetical protein